MSLDLAQLRIPARKQILVEYQSFRGCRGILSLQIRLMILLDPLEFVMVSPVSIVNPLDCIL